MLTDFLIERGFHFFASGWTQFAVAFAVSFMIMIVFGRGFIRWMQKVQGKGQPISENVPLEHRKKAGTPSMGGILMLVAIFVSSLLFMPINSMVGWIAMSSLLMFGLIGFAADYKKISSQSKNS